MNAVRFNGMSLADMDFLQLWSGLRFDPSAVIYYAFSDRRVDGREDYTNAVRANTLWRATGRKFPITDADRLFPPRPPTP